jgi:hypothetical protein
MKQCVALFLGAQKSKVDHEKLDILYIMGTASRSTVDKATQPHTHSSLLVDSVHDSSLL